MASLRARLIAAVLCLAAVGLLAVGAITYAEQRSFLYERVDDQARDAVRAVGDALAERGIGERPGPGPGRGHRGGPPHGGPPRGGGPGTGLPRGTYGQRRNASGTVLGDVVLDFDESATVRPQLPDELPVGRPITVAGYRVFAEAGDPDDLTTVAAVPLTDVEQTLNRLLLVEGLVIGGVLLALAAAASFVVRLGLVPLDRIADTAGRIAGGDLSHRVDVTDPRTEVGRLGTAFNRMLDRLEDAFRERARSEERLRRFLADASHELRTPLASIRGYAELFRIGAASEPPDVSRSMRRIEDEAARMGVLVEDLLALARVDQVAAAPHVAIDLRALVDDAADDARAMAPDRSIAIDGPRHASVIGDADQLRQVLANLLRNALVHTPKGSPIELSVTASATTVTVAVRDHGPGLPTGDASELFERFWRAERGRERGKGGAGLGLAIAAAIVDAHGGSVDAGNAPGGGAVFSVVLRRA